MNKAQFIRWANRREKAADAFREARRLLGEMMKISENTGFTDVRQADWYAKMAIESLAMALDLVADRPPQDEQGE